MRTTEAGNGRAGRPAAHGTTTNDAPPRSVRRARASTGTRWVSVVASATCLAVTAGMPGAVADDADGSGESRLYPSAADVRAAEARAEEAATDVAGVQAELAAANAELESASLTAEQAAEAYNAARWQVQEATQTLHRARAAERSARDRIAGQRDRLAALVAGSYEGGGSLSAVDAVAGTTDPASMMGQLLTFDGASSAMDATLQRYSASATLASVFKARATEARKRRVTLLHDADAAKDAAAAAAAQAEATAAAVDERRSTLVARMATLQGISVDLAAERQDAIEEEQRRRAAEEAAREAAAQAAAEAAREAARQAAAEDAAAASAPENSGDGQGSSAPAPQPAPAPVPSAAPAPPPPAPAPPPPAPAPAGGAAAAIAFAKAQVGEPYVWAAAGPDSWDCSGLTMAAWAAGGVSLPHYSVAQYEAATPISASELRPGDLLFWSTSGSPSGIHHVALYLGDGMMVHAPRTGRDVTIEPMSYYPPNLFGRV